MQGANDGDGPSISHEWRESLLVAQSAQETKRQIVDEARQAALEGRWEDAVALNERIIERFPKEAEAHNRRGRALLGLGRYGAAAEAYTAALRADPANLIARRNLQRLESLRHLLPADEDESTPAGENGDAAGATAPMPRTAVFIEEIGKTWVDELVNPIPLEKLAEVLPAEPLEIEVEGQRLIIKRHDGQHLGEIEAKTAERVVNLIQGGNRYEAYALGLSQASLRVILRESFRDPSQAGMISFPRQITSRAYLRERDLLRQRDEADFLLLDDEEEDEAAPPTDTDADEDEEPTATPERDRFIEERVTVIEEEDENSI